jgi:hypothetical protein
MKKAGKKPCADSENIEKVLAEFRKKSPAEQKEAWDRLKEFYKFLTRLAKRSTNPKGEQHG